MGNRAFGSGSLPRSAPPSDRKRQPSRLVLQTRRHLKWRALDWLEWLTMVLSGVCLAGFSTSVFFDVLTRTIGAPWLWLQEVTSTFFVYGIFIGAAAATRRNDHLYLSAITETMTGALRLMVETFDRLVVLAVALCMVYFGYINFLQGFGSFRMPSMTPIASLYAAIPLSGALIALFTVEQLVNGWRHGFASPEPAQEEMHIL
jgi:TRAP-type C4-dicarboxylate transport system permease small subunit